MLAETVRKVREEGCLTGNEEEVMANISRGKPQNAFIGNLEHHGGKKLSQQGVEFFHKLHEARKRPAPGFRGKK